MISSFKPHCWKNKRKIACMHSRWMNKWQILDLCLFVSPRSKWHRSWKTHTQSRWQGCTLSTRPNVTCWKTWGMNISVLHACTFLCHCQEYTAASSGHCHWLKATAWECRRGGMGKKKERRRRRRSIVILRFWVKDRGSGKSQRNFLLPSSCSLFLRLSSTFPNSMLYLCQLLLIHQFHFFSQSPYLSFSFWLSSCLLMTCASLAVLPLGSGGGRELWFLHRLSFSVLTKHWLFMTANSGIHSASIPVLSVFFLIFTPSPLSLLETSFSLFFLSPSSHSQGLLQLLENRLLCCCWVLEGEQDPGLTCGREGEPV